ncbi:MAG: hypothetical protein IPG71_01330 [bacterium]|nr:hypothetical protein [bacterium]
MKLLLYLLCSALGLGCSKPDHSAPGVQTLRTVSRDDSLFLAEDLTEWGFDFYSYEQWDSGLVKFNLALSYDSTNSQAWHGRALMLDTLHFEQDAEFAYRQAEKLNPRNKQAIWHLGCFYARAGEKDKALRQLRTVIALDSSYAIGVRTEDCWTQLWQDSDFLRTVGALP